MTTATASPALRRDRVLADRLGGTLAREAVLVVAGTLVLTLMARLSVPLPFTPVPVSLGTLGALSVGALGGARRSLLSVVLYTALGVAGAPVFAEDHVGWAFASFGYVLGYALVAMIAGAAAEAGKDFEEVKRVFAKANAATRSFGVAFSGCTLPGADGPLFTVPEGKMGIGLGIHGEPGVDEARLGTADEVARTLVEGLLEDRPADAGGRVIAIVNGLGATKYEELFVVVGSVVDRLEAAGVECVDVESGEFVTSLDMAGISLTLVWVDDELLSYWDAPCDTPAYRKGSVGDVQRDETALNTEATAVTVAAKGSAASQAAAGTIAGLLEAVADMLEAEKDELGKLDSVAGDGDHGIGMANGSRAAAAAAKRLVGEGAGASTTLAAAGDAWSDRAGGTSGALWGSLLTAIGSRLGDQDAPDEKAVGEALVAARDAVQRLGGAQVGDKTLVDALVPLVDAFLSADGDLKAKGEAAVAAGDAGARSTRDLVAKLGRARPLGQKSVGTPDPGAVSLVKVAAVVVERI